MKNYSFSFFIIFCVIIATVFYCHSVSYAEDASSNEGSFISKSSNSSVGNASTNAYSLKTAWKKSVRSLRDYFRFKRPAASSTPVVDADNVYTGSTGRYFYAFDARTGKKVWKFKADAKVEAGALVSGDNVYFGSTMGTFYALDRHSGQLLWKHRVRSEIQSTPVLRNSTLYISTIDGHLYAFDSQSGNKIWGYMDAATDFIHIRLRSSPAVDGKNVYAIFPSGYAVAVDALNGKEIWRIRLLKDAYPEAFVNRTPVVSDGHVYMLDTDGYLTAYDAAVGSAKVRYDVRDIVDYSLYGDSIAMITSDKVLVVKKTTGEMYWSEPIESARGRFVVYDGGVVLMAANMEKYPFYTEYLEFDATRFFVYSAVGGEHLWSKDFFKHQLSKPSFDGLRAVFVNENASLRFLSGN